MADKNDEKTEVAPVAAEAKAEKGAKAGTTEAAHECALLCIEAIWQATLVTTEMDFGIFFWVVGFLEYGNKVGTAFMQILIIINVCWINFNTYGRKTFSR